MLEKTDLAEKANYYIGNTPLKEVLKKLPKENVIYAFSQRHKTMIAKNILHEIGLTHIDIGNAYTFDKEMLALFARKLSYEQGELYFMLKYFFHAFSGHSTIDLNNSYDRKIYHALKEVKTSSAAKSVDIMTHEQLYDKLAEQDIMPYTSIFFFDQDRRYDSHIKREQKPFDLYYLLQVTDSYIYKDSLLTPGKESLWLPLHTQLVIFLGIRQTEVAGLLKDVSNTSVEMDNGVIGNTYFYKTSLLISQINETFAALSGRVNDNDYTIMHDKRKKFISIISTSC